MKKRLVDIGWTGPGAVPWQSWEDQLDGESNEQFIARIESEYDERHPEEAPHEVRLYPITWTE